MIFSFNTCLAVLEQTVLVLLNFKFLVFIIKNMNFVHVQLSNLLMRSSWDCSKSKVRLRQSFLWSKLSRSKMWLWNMKWFKSELVYCKQRCVTDKRFLYNLQLTIWFMVFQLHSWTSELSMISKNAL